MSNPIINIKVTRLPTGQFRVQSKIEGAATIGRTVQGTSLTHYLSSLGELAVETSDRRSTGAKSLEILTPGEVVKC